MLSSKEYRKNPTLIRDEFPYKSNLVCYMELTRGGRLTQLNTPAEKRAAYDRAIEGKCKIVAVVPEKTSSNLYQIDDLKAFLESLF